MAQPIHSLSAAATSLDLLSGLFAQHTDALGSARALLDPERAPAPQLDALFADLGDPAAAAASPEAVRAALAAARSPLHFRADLGSHRPEQLDQPLRAQLDFWLDTFPNQLLPRVAHPELPPEARQRMVRAAILVCADRRIPPELSCGLYHALARAFVALDGRLPAGERLSVLHCDDHGAADTGPHLWAPMALDIYGEMWLGWWGIPEAAERLGHHHAVATGEEATAALRADPYSLFITDEQHFGPPGSELAVFARTELDPRTSSELSVVLVTGFSLRPVWKTLGLDAYLSKPHRAVELLAAYNLAIHDPRHLLALERHLLE